MSEINSNPQKIYHQEKAQEQKKINEMRVKFRTQQEALRKEHEAAIVDIHNAVVQDFLCLG